MPKGVSAAQFEAFTDELYGFYAEAEQVMLAKVARRLARGINADGWAEKKLRETVAMRQEIEQAIGWLRAGDEQAARAVLEAYRGGAGTAVMDLDEIIKQNGALPNGQQWVKMGFNKTNKETVNTIARKLVDNLAATKLQVLRNTMDVYREAAGRAIGAGTAAGSRNRVETTQDLLNRLADKGITGFVDKAGRNWDLASYAEMAVRSGTGQAAVSGHTEKLEEHGIDLVVVSDSPEECELCRPWERRVLALSKQAAILNGNVPTLEEARAAGLFHANCTHRTGAYIPGLTEDASFDAGWPKGKPNPDGYAERQRQREIERTIRKWKRREAVAITPEAQRLSKSKVAEWQAEMRKFVDKTGRLRQSSREQVGTGKPGVVPPRPKPPAAITLQPRLQLDTVPMPDIPQATQAKPWEHQAAKLQGNIEANVNSGFAGNAIDKVLELGKLLRQQVEGPLRQHAEDYKALRQAWKDAEAAIRRAPSKAEEDRLNEVAKQAYKAVVQHGKPEEAARKAYAEVLGKVRPMGHVSRQPWHSGSKNLVKEHVEAIKSSFPQDWLEKAYTATLQARTAKRGYYDGLNLVNSGASVSTTWHEYMHHMERMVPGIKELEARFHARRTQGEVPTWLGPGYKKTEIAARDKFMSAYMGKVYGGHYWEIMTMGGESVFYGARGNLLLEDPEYLDFVLGVMGGV